MTTPLQYWIDIAGRSFPASRVVGREAVSEPFSIEVRFLADGPRLPRSALVRADVRLRIERGEHRRVIDGVATAATIEATRWGAASGDRARVREITLTIEPRLALLRHRRDIRVFRDRSVPEIALEVLLLLGIRTELRLAASYERRPYCVQWRESDLDFVHRLLEDEGIHYFFLDGALVLADENGAAEPLPAGRLDYRGAQGMKAEECVTWLAERADLGPGRVSLRDFNLDTPGLDMETHAPVGRPGSAEWYDYPGEYATPAEGQRRARLVAQAFACESERLEGEVTTCRIFPGGRFVLLDAPFRDDGELLVTAVLHDFAAERAAGGLRFEALEMTTPYRPSRRTRVPTLLNPHTAFVTGPPGEDVHTDPRGRVKVHFHWDRRQPLDGSCSDWVPVLQDNTGGSSAIPRVGWEVLVHYLEGDPDRPVVLGRTYNGSDAFPEILPKHKMVTGLRSLSSPSREGENVISFEDPAGKELVRITAERDKNIAVANDRQALVGRLDSSVVGRDERVEIGNDHTVAVGGTLSEIVERDQSSAVAGDRDVDVGGPEGSVIQGNRTLIIGSAHLRHVGSVDSAAAGHLDEAVLGVSLEVARRAHTTQATRLSHVAAGGLSFDHAGEDRVHGAGARRAEAVGGVAQVSAQEVFITVTGQRTSTVAGRLRAESGAAMSFTAGGALSMSGGTTSAKATRSIVLQVGGSKIVMKDGLCALTADTLRIHIDGMNDLATSLSSQG